MRPKSIATVVVEVSSPPETGRSVDSTVISEMVRMKVVLPASNGPATTTLRVRLRRRARARGESDTAGDPACCPVQCALTGSPRPR
jgi:hypothetical protein